MSAANIQKTIERTQEKISAGQFYEAHQGIRTVVARYVRQRNYPAGIEVLHSTTKQLLVAEQYSSASDLTLYLLDLYTKSETPVNAESRGRLIQILQAFPASEPSLKQLAKEVTSWSGNFGDTAFGDRELNHVIGSKFAEADLPYDAERYLTLGTKDSPAVLAKLLWEWYTEDDDESTAGFYISRAVLGYLNVSNIRDARAVLSQFLESLISSGKLEYSVYEKDTNKYYIFPDCQLLDFLQLLVETSQYKSTDMFNRLRIRFKPTLDAVPAIKEPLQAIGSRIFGIQVARQANVLQDLMGSLFK